MSKLLALPVAILLTVSLDGVAARVEYAHPDVTIVAVEESLGSVLRAVGKELQISVTLPTDINPVVNCDIQGQPLKRAFRNLLGEMSYTLEWEEGGERLLGLTVLAGDGESQAVVSSVRHSPATTSYENYSPTGASGRAVPADSAGRSSARTDPPLGRLSRGPRDAEHEAQLRAEREAMEERMAEREAKREVELAQRREQDEIAHQARMEEDLARKKAEEERLVAEEMARRP